MMSADEFEILPQPDDATCGPTCLHGLYRHFGREIPLSQIIAEIPSLEAGGTLAVFLACHALRRGFRATIHTYNLQVFDPTWFEKPGADLTAKLEAQRKAKRGRTKLQAATEGYLEFLRLGGEIRFDEMRPTLLRRYLKRGVPILAGLSATYLYRSMREFGPKNDYDDIRGEPMGHFVVLYHYDSEERTVSIADPSYPNPTFGAHRYVVNLYRAINSIMLGVLTYDANILAIEPPESPNGRA